MRQRELWRKKPVEGQEMQEKRSYLDRFIREPFAPIFEFPDAVWIDFVYIFEVNGPKLTKQWWMVDYLQFIHGELKTKKKHKLKFKHLNWNI